ncbi:MAG: hypothetical protein AAF205_00090 [Pseudomonadota bacterium]
MTKDIEEATRYRYCDRWFSTREAAEHAARTSELGSLAQRATRGELSNLENLLSALAEPETFVAARGLLLHHAEKRSSR